MHRQKNKYILRKDWSIYPFIYHLYAYNVGDLGSIPGMGRSPGEGKGKPLQNSCLENPWTEEPGRLQSMRLQRVGHDWATSLHFHVPYNFLGSVSSFTLLCIWRILKLLTAFHFLHRCVKWFAVTTGVLGLLDKLTQNVIKRGTWLYHELLIDR